MRTKGAEFRASTYKKLLPYTLVTLPVGYGSNDYNTYVSSLTDIRIGCDICHQGHACTSDIYRDKDNYNIPFPIYDLDFRVGYHYKDRSCEDDDIGEDVLDVYIVWYEMKFNTMSQSQVQRLLETANKYCSNSKEDNTSIMKETFSPYKSPPYLGKISNSGMMTVNKDYNTVYCNTHDDNQDSLLLCAVCHRWLTHLHPEYKHKFTQKSTSQVAYEAWLDEHEHELIVI